MANIINIEDDIEDDMKTTFESGPAPDIWSWGLVAGRERLGWSGGGVGSIFWAVSIAGSIRGSGFFFKLYC